MKPAQTGPGPLIGNQLHIYGGERVRTLTRRDHTFLRTTYPLSPPACSLHILFDFSYPIYSSERTFLWQEQEGEARLFQVARICTSRGLC
jgi:hypothetical protein